MTTIILFGIASLWCWTVCTCLAIAIRNQFNWEVKTDSAKVFAMLVISLFLWLLNIYLAVNTF